VLEGGEGSASRHGRFLLPGKIQFTLYRRLGGPRAGLDRCGKPGFDPRTVQSVASRYTDSATRPAVSFSLRENSGETYLTDCTERSKGRTRTGAPVPKTSAVTNKVIVFDKTADEVSGDVVCKNEGRMKNEKLSIIANILSCSR
jgi:hypothetical protein